MYFFLSTGQRTQETTENRHINCTVKVGPELADGSHFRKKWTLRYTPCKQIHQESLEDSGQLLSAADSVTTDYGQPLVNQVIL